MLVFSLDRTRIGSNGIAFGIEYINCICAVSGFVAYVSPVCDEAFVANVGSSSHGQSGHGVGGQLDRSLGRSGSEGERSDCDTGCRCRIIQGEYGAVSSHGRIGGYGGRAGGKSGTADADADGFLEAFGLDGHRLGACQAYGRNAEVNSTAIRGKQEGRVGTDIGRPVLALLVAPDVFGQFGVVDEGVAVVLCAVYDFLTVKFLLADRIFAMPFQQQVDGP